LSALALLLSPLFLLIKNVRDAFKGAWGWFNKPMASTEQSPHRVELKITPGFNQWNHWSEGAMGTKPMMFVVCHLNVANAGPTPTFQILDAYIKKPKTKSAVPLEMNNPYDGRLAYHITLDFTVEPPVCKSGQPFNADIVLVDQFSKPHTIEGVVFQALGGAGWEALKKNNAEGKEPPGSMPRVPG
jgi:hypothetical protein